MHPEVTLSTPGDCPKCGMALEPQYSIEDDKLYKNDNLRRRFWVSAVLTGILLTLTMGLSQLNITLRWAELVLATPVVTWGALPLLKKGWMSIINKNLNMFTLVALGIAVAYVFSVFTFIFRFQFPELPSYFESASVITTLVLLGQVLEMSARIQTRTAIRRLLDLLPYNAHLIDQNGNETDIAVSEIQITNHLKIKPGERIPVDGFIIQGQSFIDESMITGEAVPVVKVKNDKLIAGTMNTTGSLIMEATRIGKDTLLSQIIDLVNHAQRSRVPIQSIADKVAAILVPVVVAVAIITFLCWIVLGPPPQINYAVINAVSVLIIACPCALGLATPISLMLGIGLGAKYGILIKDARVFENLKKVNTLVFDKTGTLTEGKARLTFVHALSPFKENEILRWAASIEQNSEHPFAHAIIKTAKQRSLTQCKVKDFESFSGMGIRGNINKKSVVIGNATLFDSLDIKIISLKTIEKEKYKNKGTPLFITINGQEAGILEIEDPIKRSALVSINLLKSMGFDIVMLTGDHTHTAKAVGQILGIDLIFSEILPHKKYEIIKLLQTQGRKVAMVGDGINDAPALAQADVGIAMGNGTDVAIESADIILVKGNLEGLISSIKLSRATMTNIEENIFWAFVYNFSAIPIAAGLLYPFFGILLNPMIAAAAMSLSSISVVINALRLNRFILNKERVKST